MVLMPDSTRFSVSSFKKRTLFLHRSYEKPVITAACTVPLKLEIRWEGGMESLELD
jgi:hypothetical protein